MKGVRSGAEPIEGPLAGGRARRWAGAALLACSLLLGTASASTAAPTWLSAHTLSPGPSAEGPQVALDAQGDAVAVWQTEVAGLAAVAAAVRPAGGEWSAGKVISPAGEAAQSPAVAVGSSGQAIAVWERVSGGKYRPEAAAGSARTGSWSAPVLLLKEGPEKPLLARVAVNTGGAGIAGWDRLGVTNGVVEAVDLQAGPGGLSAAAPRVLSESAEPDMGAPGVGIADGGRTVIVWEEKEAGKVVIAASVRPAPGGPWPSPTRISGNLVENNSNHPDLAMNARGDTAVVWERFTEVENVDTATLPAGAGAWSAPSRVSAVMEKPKGGFYEPGDQHIAIDGEGRAAVVWLREVLNRIEASFQGAGGAWSEQSAISPEGVLPSDPVVAADGAGDDLAAWVSEAGGKATLASARRASGSNAWSPPVALLAEAKDEEPALAMDRQGNAVAAWRRHTASYSIEAAGFDGAGPLPANLSIPSSGIVGRALSFAVSPLDAWSALGATGWNFGDGATAGGPSAVHAFTAPGSYRVTVTSADVLGNTSTAGANVTVLPCPVGIPPACAPVSISGPAQSRARWREGRAAALLAVRSAKPAGTVFTFTLNQPARVTFTFTRAAAGRRVKGRCVAPSKGNARRPRCTRALVGGQLVVQAHTGPNRVSFQGRYSGSRHLAPGTWRMLTTAAGAGSSAAGRALTFTILR